ncbi:iron chelate uptake ABC transporter family permease subunit [Terribacillus sp. 179-K 1B1 HS]|uniref:FecCD family ABC transporter permease n=1 Tax=Terribacillus sp. 179-K 1B1 HS TaxID=3142388 RepID=UPI0039A21A85
MNTTSAIRVIKQGRQRRFRKWLAINGLLALLATGLCIAMLLLGNTIYPISEVFQVLMGERVPGAYFAVNTIRLPRMAAGVFAGLAFGMAGHIFQTMLRNPLANPDVLGITTGSSAAALFSILIFQTSNTAVSLASVIAGLVTVLLIYILSSGSHFSIGRLILIGIGFQAALSAVISYLLMIGSQEDMPAALRWLSGSLNGAKMETLLPLICTVLICAPLLLVLGKHLDILELGEESALSLGLSTNKIRLILILSAVFMIAFATATTGPIAFVAFLSGPIAKRLVGTGYSNVLTAGLVGINLVLGADLIGQFAFEVRYPVGIITGLVGAPYLLYLLIRMNRKGYI